MQYEKRLDSLYKKHPDKTSALIKALLKNRDDVVIEKFPDSAEDYKGLASNGKIRISESSYNPHILAHELGHIDTLGNWKHRLLIDPIGHSGTLIQRYIHKGLGDYLIRRANTLKEQEANNRGLELLRSSGASDRLLDRIAEAYRRRLERE